MSNDFVLLRTLSGNYSFAKLDLPKIISAAAFFITGLAEILRIYMFSTRLDLLSIITMVDDLPILAICQSGTSAILSTDVKHSVYEIT